MTTSVPSVISIEELQYRIWQIVSLAQHATQETGDFSYLDRALALARKIYEERFKVASHGPVFLDEELRKALERAEEAVERAKLVAQ